MAALATFLRDANHSDFDLSQYESVIIPKRFLSHGSDEQVMKEILLSTVGPKAKLLG